MFTQSRSSSGDPVAGVHAEDSVAAEVEGSPHLVADEVEMEVKGSPQLVAEEMDPALGNAVCFR